MEMKANTHHKSHQFIEMDGYISPFSITADY